MSYAAFDLEKNEASPHVAEVVLKGPGKGNAMGPDFWKEAPQVFQELDDDEEVRAVLLRGQGKTFCYGLDLMAMSAELAPLMGEPQTARGRTELLGLIRRMQKATTAAWRCKKPVIAAVHGFCIGGALDLAAACDLRLCSSEARFSLREVKLAMVADVGVLQHLPAVIGEGAVRELAFTGKDIDAERARALGLVNEVYASPEALLEGARTLARDIARNPPLVVQGVKEVLNARLRSEIERGLEHVSVWNAAFLQSQDLMEALTAFAEKRPPEFKGE